MKRMDLWRFLPLILFIPLCIFLYRGLFLHPSELPSAVVGKALPGDIPFRTHMITQNEAALLNVWASWCEACNEEQVFLLKLQRQGIKIYGLNYKDDPLDAKIWLETWGNPYVMIAEDQKGRIAMDLGVYGAPETFLIDKNGIVQYRWAGILNETIWEREILPRMKKCL